MTSKNKRRKKSAQRTVSASYPQFQREGYNHHPRLDLAGLQNSKAYLTMMTAEEVYNLYKRKKLVIPRFQRKGYVWKKNQNQELVVTMLHGYPVLPLLVQYVNGKYILLDGQQRLLNEFEFMNNRIKISKTFDPLLGGLRWKDLEPETRKHYKNYPVPFLVVVGGNGIGVQTYIRANSGLPINAPEKRKARYFNTAFFKLVKKVQKSVQTFYTVNGILTRNDILRSKEEDVLAENIILVMREITDGSDLDDLYEQWKTPKKLSQYIKGDPVKVLNEYFDIINEMFPNGLKKTHFANLNNFYGLLGAVKVATEKDLLPKSKGDKELVGKELTKFLENVRIFSTTGNGSALAGRYLRTISRGTRDFKNREDRINILVDLITKN
jgi:hypothetical protein